jgi:hypothetical protein
MFLASNPKLVAGKNHHFSSSMSQAALEELFAQMPFMEEALG